MLSHSEARRILARAFQSLGMDASPRELQAIQAIGSLESYYGERYRNNWGNIQCNPGTKNCVEGSDTRADGSPYVAYFRTFETPEEGAAALIQNLYRRPLVIPALVSGSARDIAREMRASGYYEAPLERYSAGLESRAKQVAKELNEPYLLGTAASGAKKPGPWLAALGLGTLVLALARMKRG